MNQQFTESFQECGGEVFRAGGGAGDEHDEIVFARECRFEDTLQFAEDIRHGLEYFRLRAALRGQRREHLPVHFEQRAFRQGRRGVFRADDFVAGGDDQNARLFKNLDRQYPGGEQGGLVVGPQTVAGREEDFALDDIFSRLAHVAPRIGRLADFPALQRFLRLFDHHDRVFSIREGIAGVHRVSGIAREEDGFFGQRAERVGGLHRDAVHRGGMVRRHGRERLYRSGEHAAECAPYGNRLRPDPQAAETPPEDAPRLVERLQMPIDSFFSFHRSLRFKTETHPPVPRRGCLRRVSVQRRSRPPSRGSTACPTCRRRAAR